MTTVDRTRAARDAAAALTGPPAGRLVAGFDGFIDRITHVVDRRTDAETYSRVRSIRAFSERLASAAGRSANAELVTVREKLGGNAAILAAAAGALGVAADYIGTLDDTPIFDPLRARTSRALAIGPPGVTDALEFDDGKVMLGRPAALGAVTWLRVLDTAGGAEGLTELLRGAMLTMGNWTMTPAMTDIWQRLAAEILPSAGCTGVFVDLSDPARRTDGELRTAIDALRDIDAHAPVTLGCNIAEGARLARVLGGQREPAAREDGTLDTGPLAAFAHALHTALGLSRVSVHTRRTASIADAEGASAIDAPFVREPLVSTGAGDHFNAGVCAGLLAGMPRDSALACGVACSGLYVRTGESPSREELTAFLVDLPAAEPA